MPFNRRTPDSRTLRLHWRKITGVWYLEWRASDPQHSRVVSRRKAHDTEVVLLERIRELEAGTDDKSRIRSVREFALQRGLASKKEE